jgi:hypothetical protein
MARMLRENPKAFETLNARIKELDGIEVRVGWFSSNVYPDKYATPVAYVAAIQELGSPKNKIPPRPFMRPTVMKQWSNWQALMLKGAKAILKGTWSAREVMDALGAQVAGDIAKTIRSIWTPPLKEATVRARARKYSSGEITDSLRKPLVATARLVDSISHVVSDSK